MASRDPEDLVCIPLIIEVKSPKSEDPGDVNRSLEEAVDQLQEQARFLFADFGFIQEAGVGMYWWWFKMLRPEDLSQQSSSEYKPGSSASSDTVDASPQTPPTLPRAK